MGRTITTATVRCAWKRITRRQAFKLGVESWLRLAIHVRENGREALHATRRTQQHEEKGSGFQGPKSRAEILGAGTRR